MINLNLQWDSLRPLPLVGKTLLVGASCAVGIMLPSAPAPAQASSCSSYYASSVAVPSGYGAAYNLFSSAKQLEVSLDCSGTPPKPVVASRSNSQYTSKQGHIDQNSTGQSLTLITSTNSLVIGTWYPETTSATLSQIHPYSWNYAVGHVCYGDRSKSNCGCSDSFCAASDWQLQAFKRNSPPPNTSGGGGGGTVSCSAQPSGATVTISPDSDIQGAINNASAGTTVVFAPGMYTIDGTIELKSRVNLAGQSGTVLKWKGPGGANMIHGRSISDVTIAGFTLDGGRSGGSGDFNAAIVIEYRSTNVHIQCNHFQYWQNIGGVGIWDSAPIYVRKNTFGATVGRLTEHQPISGHDTAGITLSGFFVTDNEIYGCKRMCIETLLQNTDAHYDRNYIHDFGNGVFAISVADLGGVKYNRTGTIWANTIVGTRGAGQWGIEQGQTNMTVKHNQMTNVDFGIFIAGDAGSVYENNTFTNCGSVSNKDGGFDPNQGWIGNNTINGQTVFGWDQLNNENPKPAVNRPSATP